MYEAVRGLVLRETQYKENDKLLSVLTGEQGLITVKARGVKSQKSKLRSGCGLLTYSSFSLYEKNGYFTVTEAEPIEMFSRLRQDLELLSLGSYFAQVLEAVSPEQQSDQALLSLGLNCLYALDRLGLSQGQVKAAFELRLLCIIGFQPMLEGCAVCGDPNALEFSPTEGTLRCSVCRTEMKDVPFMRISPGVLDAMRYIAECDPRRLFSFTLPEKAMRELGAVTERFLLAQLDEGFSALGFYKRLFPELYTFEDSL